jgi:hypothetical protein
VFGAAEGLDGLRAAPVVVTGYGRDGCQATPQRPSRVLGRVAFEGTVRSGRALAAPE